MRCLILIIVFLFTFLNINLHAEEKNKIFPQDTMQQFIDKYGNDSLVEILNNEIKQATNYIQKNWTTLKLDEYNLPAIMASRYYKLGFDTLDYYDEHNQFYFYSLFNQFYGDTLELMQTIRAVKNELKSKEKNFRNYEGGFKDSIDYSQKNTVFPTAMLCYLIESDGFCGELVYNYFDKNKMYMSMEEKIQSMIYLAMVLRNDDYKNYPTIKNSLERILLKIHHELSFEESYRKIFIEPEHETVFTDDNEIKNFYFSIVLNNYILYSKSNIIEELGKDLFYLLSLPKDKSGLYEFFKEKSYGLNVHLKIQISVLLAQWKEYLSQN